MPIRKPGSPDFRAGGFLAASASVCLHAHANSARPFPTVPGNTLPDNLRMRARHRTTPIHPLTRTCIQEPAKHPSMHMIAKENRKSSISHPP